VASVTAAGGVPVLIVAGPDVDPLAMTAVLDHCQSLVVTGGGDIDPEYYGTADTTMPAVLMDVDPARDVAEIAVVQHAMAQRKRVLGVCRGAQLLAVMGGGSLIADLAEEGIDGHWDEVRQYEPVHAVSAETGSVAADIVGPVTQINSIHHQAIAEAGQHVRPTAWSPDGVIEAVEGPGLLGVQWHPERLAPIDADYLTPFLWVVGA
jgi:putative glutamine amidotransferase